MGGSFANPLLHLPLVYKHYVIAGSNPTAGGVAHTFSLVLRGVAMIVCRKEFDVLNIKPLIIHPLLSLL